MVTTSATRNVDATPESVAKNVLGHIGKPTAQLRLFIEPIVGHANGRAVVFIHGPMKLIGSTLGDEVDLRSGRSAGTGVIVAGGDTEFLEGVEGGAHGAGKRKTVELIVVIETIKCDVRLIAARAIDRPAAAVTGLVHIVADVNDSRLQTEN